MSDLEDHTPRIPPSNARPAILFGLAVIIFGLATFAAWATVANLSSAIIGSGTVKALSNRKIVQSLEGGTVREITVENGQSVKVGDMLIQLDETKARTALDVVQSAYDLALATVARLQAERDQLDKIDFPESLLLRAGDPNVADIIASQNRQFAARQNAFNGQIEVLGEQAKQLKEQINGLTAQSTSQADQIAISQRDYDDMTGLLENNLVSKSRVTELERELARLKGTKADIDSRIAAAQAQVSQAELEILQLRATFEKDIADELGTKEAEMYALEQQVLDAKHTLEQKVIRATENGTVVGLNVYTVGGVVEPGATLMEIVPTSDNMIIEARIRPVDVDNVRFGMEAEIVFPGFSRRELPRLTGFVTYVSADALTDQRTGVPYFAAKVTLSDEDLIILQDHQLLPGMPADVFIKTGERSPLTYLLEPLTESFARAWRET